MAQWQHPFPKSTITSGFGSTRPPRTSPHRGTDYAPNAKTLIPAITDGKVTKIAYSNILGWFMEFVTDEHGLYIGHAHLYCHKHDTITCNGKDHNDGSTCMKNLKVGHRVEIGQPVGRVGNSGASRGAHLHITASKKPDMRFSKPFDIEQFIDQKIAKQNRKKKVPKIVKPKKDKPEPMLFLGQKFGRFWTIWKKKYD
ncbi:MAG: M23 family metallopeptidase [Patescibacteria group bacterium]